MKLKNNITALLAALGLLASCSDDVTSPTYTVGEAINAITLRAGISEGGEGVHTRAVDGNHAGTANGGAHVPFNPDVTTQLRLRVDGTWLGKADGSAPHGTISSTTVSQETTATIGVGIKVGSDTENTHNEVTFTPTEQLYWDDYGTADPDNTTGRTTGLTIYGVAVEGEDAPAVDGTPGRTWNELTWELKPGQTGGYNKLDLLTSNNIRVSPGDGTYKFDDFVNDLKNSASTSSNLLEFTHAMTKITVNLTAGEGFPGYETGAENAKFQTAPTVKLLDFNYTGTVNVETKASTPTSATTTNINAYRDNGSAWVSGGQHTSQFTALVFPGNQFTANIADDTYKTPTSTTEILELNADGNVYKVTAAQLVKAIAKKENNDVVPAAGDYTKTLEQAKNYILNIIVNKTGIEVTATIKNWDNVTADPVTPIINFSDCYGETGTNFGKGFTLYRSTNVDGSYISGIAEGNNSTVSYESSYTMLPQLYWPDHETHYFFRGVYPQVNTTDGPADTKVKANAVEVTNVAYTQNKYPSDLMIGMPRNSEGGLDETCKAGHNTAGICATDAAEGSVHANEGLIHMNFQYAMAQVEVELQTVDSPDAAKVNINENTVVELVNVYNSGEVKLSDGSVTTSGEMGNYTLATVTGDDKKLFRHSAIVPQNLTFTEKGATTNLRFKITVTNNDGTTDVYYADVNPIKEKDKDTLIAPNGKWESGVHYKYVLKLSKTAVNVTATITDWVTVTASDDVWF